MYMYITTADTLMDQLRLAPFLINKNTPGLINLLINK